MNQQIDGITSFLLQPIGIFKWKLFGRELWWYFERLISILVLIRVTLTIVEVQVFHSVNSLQSPVFFLYAERFIAVCLTIELIVRLHNASHKLRYLNSPMGWVDILSVLPFWLGFIPAMREWLGIVRAFRMISLLKLARYSFGLQQIIKELSKLWPVLKTVLLITLTQTLMMGYAMYQAEHLVQPDKFTGVFDGFWWASVTATTIGYGDLFPITAVGRFIAMIMMFSGCAFMGAYMGIFGTAVVRAYKAYLVDEEDTSKKNSS